MPLKPQDIVVVLKIVARRNSDWTYNGLALELGMSPSEVHGAVKRLAAARLMVPRDMTPTPTPTPTPNEVREAAPRHWLTSQKGASSALQPMRQALEEFLVSGVRYAFYPERGPLVRGMPTAHAAPPLNALIMSGGEAPPVWPDPEGEVRGYALEPLYKSVPYAAKQDAELYALLALVDAIRDGRARERALAVKALQARLQDSES